MDSFAVIPNSLYRESHIFETNYGPRSDIMLIGRPCLDQTSWRNRSAGASTDVRSSSLEQGI